MDNCIFHVNQRPMCNLRRMPPTADALHAYEEVRNFMAMYATIPSENRWESGLDKLVPPVEQELMDAYAALECVVAVDIVPPPPDNETTKTRRMWAHEFIFALHNSRPFLTAVFRAHDIDTAGKPSAMTRDVLNFLNHVTLRPPIALASNTRAMLANMFNTPECLCVWGRRCRNKRRCCRYTANFLPLNGTWKSCSTWVRTNLCVYFQPHLQDEANLHAGVVSVIRVIEKRKPPKDTVMMYGVLNSLTHCVLVSYDTASRAVRHTHALPLLPPWGEQSAREPTPGLIALTSLCQHLDSAAGGYPGLFEPKVTRSGRLPFDVLSYIADMIEDSVTLLCFASASSVCKLAAKPRLMLPKLDRYIVEACAGGHGFDLAGGRWADLTKYWTGERPEVDEALSLFTSQHGKYWF